MSLSMISIISVSEVSFEYGFELGFGDFVEVCLYSKVICSFSM